MPNNDHKEVPMPPMDNPEVILAHYQRIMEKAGFVIFTADSDGIFRHVSGSVTPLTGYQPEEIINKHFTTLVHPDRREEVRDFYLAQRDRLQTDSMLEFPIITRDGEERWVEQTVVLIQQDDTIQYQAVVQDITKRHENEIRMRINDELYRTLARNLPEMTVMIFDRDMRFLIVEGPALNLQGYSKKEMEGKTLQDIFGDNLDIEIETNYRRTLDGDHLKFEFIVNDHVFSVTTLPIYGADEEIFGGMVMVQDITERTRIEKAIRDSERLFRGLFDSNLDAVFFVTPDGIVKDVNQQAAFMLGYTVEEMVGQPARRFQVQPNNQASEEIRLALLRGEKVPLYSRVYRRKDGSTFEAELNTALVHHQDGTPSHIQNIIRDITERNDLQQRLTRQVDQLTTLREVDAELADRLNVDYVLTMGLDSAVRLSGADAGFIALIDEHGAMTLGNMLGHYTRQLVVETLQNARGTIGKVIKSRQGEFLPDISDSADYVPTRPETRAQITIPLTSREKLVGILNLETSRTNMFTEDGFNLTKLLATRIGAAIDNARLHNQTETQLAELRVLYQRVQKLEQIKTDMIRIASHDLNNPLAAIVGHAELIQLDLNEMADPGDLPDYLEQIKHAARRMRKITSDILSLERIEQTVYNANHKAFSLIEQATEITRQHTNPILLEQRELVLNMPKEDILVMADPVQISEAISNIIGNAIKYTRKDGRIEVRVRLEGRKAIFEVEDNGYGIREDLQARLFQPFYRARTGETQEIEGTGLGLHLVKNIIERHKGKMHFSSVYGEGSIFGFYLIALGDDA